MKKYRALKKRLNLILVIAILCANFIVPVQAHNVYMFVTLIDNQTFSYRGYVLYDPKTATNDGSQHLERKIGDFRALGDGTSYNSNYLSEINGGKDSSSEDEPSTVFDGAINIFLQSYDSVTLKPIKDDIKNDLDTSIGAEDNMIFSFPSKNIDNSGKTKLGMGILGGRNNATSLDQSRAYYIKDSLLQNLNQALYFINNNKNYTSVEGLVIASQELAKGGTTSTGYSVNYDKSTGICSITSPQGVVQEFTWLVSKGYTQKEIESGIPNTMYREEYEGTVEFITWIQCIQQANYCYMVRGYSASTVSSLKEPSAIVKGVTEVFSGFLDGIRSNLGMWDLDDLFFNDGIRGNSQIYQFGAITTDRYSNSVKYYQIALIIALSIINIAFTYLTAQFVWDTSTMKKIRIAEGTVRLICGAAGVFLVYPLFNTLLQLNKYIVDLLGVSHVMPFKNYAYASGMIENILLEIYYFFIMIYFNIMYIIREFTLLLLLASGPIFIISIAFDSRMTLLKKWISLLVYSIFMQSIHIFVLSTLLPNIVAGRGIEQVVGYFVLIPITTAFKTALLGKEGAFMGTLSGAGAAIGTAVPLQMGASFIGGLARGGGSFAQKQFRGDDIDTSTPLSSKNAISGRSYLATMPKPIDANYSSGQTISSNSGYARAMFSSKGYQVAKNVAGTTARIGTQVAAAMPYAGMALALGGENQQIARISSSGIAQGVKGIGDEASAGVQGAIGSAKNAISDKVGEFGKSNMMQGVYNRKIAAGKEVNPVTHAQVGPNGSTVMHYDKGKLQATEQVVGAFSSGNKGRYTTVNYGNQANSNVKGIRDQYSQAIQSGNNEHLDYLKSKGIQSVETNDNGETLVTYNHVGKQQMNIAKAEEKGSSIVVTKDFGQKAATNWSYHVPEYAQATSTQHTDTSNSQSYGSDRNNINSGQSYGSNRNNTEHQDTGQNYGTTRNQASATPNANNHSQEQYRKEVNFAEEEIATSTQTPVRAKVANNYVPSSIDREIIDHAVGDTVPIMGKMEIDQNQIQRDIFQRDDSSILD